MRPKKIIVSGYISCDITPTFENPGKPMKLSDYFRPGLLNEVGRAAVSAGGCISNTGLALHRFGADTLIIGEIGDDAFGQILKDIYKAAGAKSDFLVSKEMETSYTIAIAPPGCDRIFFADTGANNVYSADDVDMDTVAGAGYFHFGYPSLMRRFYENGAEQTVRLFRSVKEKGVLTSLDMAMADQSSEAFGQDWDTALRKILPYVDIFTPSIEEMIALIEPEHYARLLEKSGGEDMCLHLSLSEDVRPLAERLLDMGAHCVMLKCGAAGIYLATADDMSSVDSEGTFTDPSWNGIRFFEDSFVPDRIVSGTGAGDTAIAAFLYSVMNGMPPKTCLENAAGTGAMNLTQKDSQSGLLSIADLRKKIDSGWKHQHIMND